LLRGQKHSSSFAVFEYLERNNVTGYQNDTEDVITGLYDLSSPYLPWKDLVYERQNYTVNDTEVSVWYVTAETLDGVFTVRFVIAGVNVVVEGVALSTSSAKIDIDIKWFTDDHVKANWTTGPSAFPKAQVGLLSVFVAEAAEAEFNGDSQNPLNNSNPTVSFVMGQFVGFFSYETQAGTVVDGVQAVGYVHAEITEAAEGGEISNSFSEEFVVRILWFSFEGYRPSEVSWDPEFGALGTSQKTNPTTSTSTSSSPLSTSSSTSSTTNFSNGLQLLPSIVSLISAFIFYYFF